MPLDIIRAHSYLVGATASHKDLPDGEAGEQHPGIGDECHTFHGHQSAFPQESDEGKHIVQIQSAPVEVLIEPPTVSSHFPLLAQVHGQYL